MCDILYIKSDKALPKELIRTLAYKLDKANSDGLGIADFTNGTLEKAPAKVDFTKIKRSNHLLIHARLATHGEQIIKNTQPFFNKKTGLTFAHNGIFSGTGANSSYISVSAGFGANNVAKTEAVKAHDKMSDSLIVFNQLLAKGKDVFNTFKAKYADQSSYRLIILDTKRKVLNLFARGYGNPLTVLQAGGLYAASTDSEAIEIIRVALGIKTKAGELQNEMLQLNIEDYSETKHHLVPVSTITYQSSQNYYQQYYNNGAKPQTATAEAKQAAYDAYDAYDEPPECRGCLTSKHGFCKTHRAEQLQLLG